MCFPAYWLYPLTKRIMFPFPARLKYTLHLTQHSVSPETTTLFSDFTNRFDYLRHTRTGRGMLFAKSTAFCSGCLPTTFLTFLPFSFGYRHLGSTLLWILWDICTLFLKISIQRIHFLTHFAPTTVKYAGPRGHFHLLPPCAVIQINSGVQARKPIHIHGIGQSRDTDATLWIQFLMSVWRTVFLLSFREEQTWPVDETQPQRCWAMTLGCILKWKTLIGVKLWQALTKDA